jgi:hypothetical protein
MATRRQRVVRKRKADQVDEGFDTHQAFCPLTLLGNPTL